MTILNKLAWPLAGVLVVTITVLVCAPATFLAGWVERSTNGRFVVGDVEGSLWQGSGFIGVAASSSGDLTPLLPGRFVWHLSPIVLLGQIDLDLSNPAALQTPLHLTGNLHQLQISPSALSLPSERLSGLGAPLNTLKPSGQIVLAWDELELDLEQQQLDLSGVMRMTMTDMSSAMSPIRPLGSYLMKLEWHGQQADLVLSTAQGPLLLSGTGLWNQGHLRFSGLARAQDGQEDNLAKLLNLLGQRKPGVEKNVIMLEFN